MQPIGTKFGTLTHIGPFNHTAGKLFNFLNLINTAILKIEKRSYLGNGLTDRHCDTYLPENRIS